MTRKLSTPMADMLMYAAKFGRTQNHGTTARALVNRELVTAEITLPDHSGLVVSAQLTDAGWLALINHSADTAEAVLHMMIDAHADAIEMHADHLTVRRTVLTIQRSMLAAPVDATWFGTRSSTTAACDEDVAMASVQYGPWTGHTAAWHGIMAAIADEANEMAHDAYCVGRLGKIGAAFLADPNRLIAAFDGLQFAIWTNGRAPLSEIDLAHVEALDIAASMIEIDEEFVYTNDRIETDPSASGYADPTLCPLCEGTVHSDTCTDCGARVGHPPTWPGYIDDRRTAAETDADEPRELLAPMTSVAHVCGSTGRVVSDNGALVTVRLHRPSHTLPHQNYDRENEYPRNYVRTAADLWESIEDVARAQLGLHEPSLFWVSDNWAGIDDDLCRYIPWRDHITDTRSWDRAEDIRFVMLASYGDYVGTTVDAANHKWFMDAYFTGQYDPLAYEVGSNERDGIGVAVRIGDPRWDIARLAQLESEITGLADYPAVDDMSLSQYECALQEEWWGNSGLNDLKIDIDAHFDALSVVDSHGNPYTWETAVLASDLTYNYDDREELLAAYFFEAVEYWETESATSMYPNSVKSVAEYVISEVFAAEQPNHYGPVSTADGDVWLSAAEMAAHALSASPLAHLVISYAGLGCERCGRPELTPLDNGTYPRHTNPLTRKRCHASGTTIHRESE